MNSTEFRAFTSTITRSTVLYTSKPALCLPQSRSREKSKLTQAGPSRGHRACLQGPEPQPGAFQFLRRGDSETYVSLAAKDGSCLCKCQCPEDVAAAFVQFVEDPGNAGRQALRRRAGVITSLLMEPRNPKPWSVALRYSRVPAFRGPSSWPGTAREPCT